MRAVFGVLSLLIVVLVVGVLVKKQLGAVSAPAGLPAASAPSNTGSGASLSPQQQSNQAQQQIKQTLEGTLQQARPMPDEK